MYSIWDCRQCGYSNSWKSRYCGHCGKIWLGEKQSIGLGTPTTMNSVWDCRQCGYSNSWKSRYCGHCGKIWLGEKRLEMCA